MSFSLCFCPSTHFITSRTIFSVGEKEEGEEEEGKEREEERERERSLRELRATWCAISVARRRRRGKIPSSPPFDCGDLEGTEERGEEGGEKDTIRRMNSLFCSFWLLLKSWVRK